MIYINNKSSEPEKAINLPYLLTADITSYLQIGV